MGINPKISIVTVTYNSEKFLEETIRNIIAQDYDNLEYIIVDGQSTDGTIDIIKKYEDYITTWISEPDKGMYDALNKGFALATGDVFGYINSDDLYSSDAIQFAAEEYAKKPYDLLYGDTDFIDENSKLLYKHFLPSLSKQEIVQQQRLHINQQSAFWSRRAFETLNGFDLKYKLAADCKFLYEIFLRKDMKVTKVNKVLGAFRKHDEALSQVQLKEIKVETKDILKELEIWNPTIVGKLKQIYPEGLFKIYNWRKYVKYTLPKYLNISNK